MTMRSIVLFCLNLLVVAIGTPAASAAGLRVGALQHDTDFGGSRRESGTDVNLEWLGDPLPVASIWHGYAGPPIRPFAGYSGHMAGDATDEAYGGGVVEMLPGSEYEANLGLGLALHDGKLARDEPDRNALGQRILFYSSLELGRFWGAHGLFLYFQHSSNGILSGPNDGINNLGVRYGYRFNPTR